jgi:hypothetical protein
VRILIASDSFGVTGHGAGLAHAALAADLAARGHAVRAVACGEHVPDAPPGVDLLRWRCAPHLGREAAAWAADVVLAGGWHRTAPGQIGEWVPLVALADGPIADHLRPTASRWAAVVSCAWHLVEDLADVVRRVLVLHPGLGDVIPDAGPGEVAVWPACSREKGGDLIARLAGVCPEVGILAVRLPGRDDAVHLLDRLPNVRIVPGPLPLDELVRATRVLLLPTRRDAMPGAARVALRHGRVVLLSDLPGCREACGAGALYLDPDDVAGWADALRRAWRGELLPGPLPAVHRERELDAVEALLCSLSGAPAPTPRAPLVDLDAWEPESRELRERRALAFRDRESWRARLLGAILPALEALR